MQFIKLCHLAYGFDGARFDIRDSNIFQLWEIKIFRSLNILDYFRLMVNFELFTKRRKWFSSASELNVSLS